MANREKTFQKVRQAVAEALANEEEVEVTGEATPMGDLGAESIDLLDIVFRLEKSFNIKIPRGDLLPENVMSDPKFVSDGKITADGLKELRQRMPWADLDRISEDTSMRDLFTVNTVVNYLATKLGG